MRQQETYTSVTQSDPIRIGIDVNSGDRTIAKKGREEQVDVVRQWVHAAKAVLEQCQDKNLEFVLAGPEEAISSSLKSGVLGMRRSISGIEIVDSPAYYDNEGKAQGEGKNSFKTLLGMQKNGEIDSLVAANDTRVMYSLTHATFGRPEFIENKKFRPPFVAEVPNVLGGRGGQFDVGANDHQANLDQLLGFTSVGIAYARSVLGQQNPRIGILSNGTESKKGTPLVRELDAYLSDLFSNGTWDVTYVGQADQRDTSLFKGSLDILIADGYSGNLVLKASEGTAELMKETLKDHFSPSIKRPLATLSGILFQLSSSPYKDRLDPDNFNGSPFLGMPSNGFVLKAHGNSKPKGKRCALERAVSFVEQDTYATFMREFASVYEDIFSAS